ncbi:tetratricopeptide repeat protein [Candidatus Micrarchaeota archaeon]|nr:tetratricopeptide repeat protein [Candidatus Micrarchaeota archaeon]
MDDIAKAKKLLANQKYDEARDILDRMLETEKKNDELYYLRGVLSLKLKNYKKAQEYLDRALFLKNKAGYHRTKGMAFFEIYEIDSAVNSFLSALALEPDDAVAHFFLAMCYLLMDDPLAVEHIRTAKEIDSKKTKQLLSNFFTLFLEKDPHMTEEQKKKIAERIKTMK